MIALVILAIFTSLVFAQPPGGGRGAPQTTPPAAATPPVADKPLVEEAPIVTKHEIHANGKTLSYTATAGMMPIKNAQGDIEANLFYVSYVLDGTTDVSKRPLMVAFNGGPGSASVWLHMGCIGPKRVKMMDDGAIPAAHYQLIDNDNTWIVQADLRDPAGRDKARRGEPAAEFNRLQGDIESVGEFIRSF
jgi:carboxypeptidase C (cathepsin A)